MALDLEDATRVEGEGGRYLARLSEDWEIWGPNGGYLATFALRAAGKVAQIKQPASFYCHFSARLPLTLWTSTCMSSSKVVAPSRLP